LKLSVKNKTPNLAPEKYICRLSFDLRKKHAYFSEGNTLLTMDVRRLNINTLLFDAYSWDLLMKML
jgi:hypothetical protein